MKRILVVDDDSNLRSIIRDILIMEGFTAVTAPDGISALREFKDRYPDAVILDHNMPGIKGIDALKEMRKMNSSVPVVILTGMQDPGLDVEARASGVFEIMHKPPDFRELILTVKRAIYAGSHV